MATLPAQDLSVDLRAVTVRPTWGAQEHRRWDRLVAEHHYLPFHGVIGKGLRHVAVHGETWLALIGWQPGAFKLAARDRWIGWPAEQQFRRLHLIANNSRFVILTPGRVRNLASRVLGLSLRRLSQDIQAVHGYPVFLAETFVDVSRFVGTCYRASNWRSLGLTRGFAREPGGSARWRHHGQPKEIFVFELTDAAAEALSRTEVPAHWNAEQHTEPMAAPRLRSLFECLGEVPECRRDRGKRYPLNTVLAIAVAARLARLPRCERVRPVRRPALPGAARGSGCVLEPEQAALHRARNHHLPQHPRRAAARDPGQRHRSVDRPAQHGTCACRHGREGPARCLEADRRRAPDDGRGGGTRLRHGPRAGGGRQQEQRNPGRTRALQQPRPRRPHCHRRCDARPATRRRAACSGAAPTT